MNPYTEKLQAYLANRPVNRHWEDAQSILELLCYIYVEQNPIENSTILYQYQKLDQLLEDLSLRENDQLSDLICDICTEYARQAFLSGVHVGFSLFTELEN